MLKITDYNTTHGIPSEAENAPVEITKEASRDQGSELEEQPVSDSASDSNGVEDVGETTQLAKKVVSPKTEDVGDDFDDDLIGLNEVLNVELQKLRGSSENYAISTNLPTTFERMEQADLTALCLSGGGIRSATFGLGVVQALASHKLLDKFDYLSTVSGGGYLGSWLSAWIFRELQPRPDGSALPSRLSSEGVGKVQEKINCEYREDERDNPSSEADEVRHLRDYSNYMTPKLGSFSADTWTMIGMYFRNLILNWTIALPLLAAVLMIPRLVYSLMFHESSTSWGIFAHWIFIIALILGSSALAYAVWRLPSKGMPKSPYSDSEKYVLLYSVLPLFLFSLVSVTVWAWSIQSNNVAEAFKSVQIPIGGTFFQYLFYSAGLYILGFVLFKMRQTLGSKVTGISRSDVWGIVAAFVASLNGGLLVWVVQNTLQSKLDVLIAVGPDGAFFPSLIYQCLSVPIFLLSYLFAATIFVGLSSRQMTDADREWMARLGAWLLIVSVIWLVLNAIVLFGPYFVDRMINAKYESAPDRIVAAVAAISAIASGIIGLLGGYSGVTPANQEQAPTLRKKALVSLPKLASVVFLLFVLVAIAYASSFSMQYLLQNARTHHLVSIDVLRNASVQEILILIAGLGIIGIAMSIFVNVNKFSMHGGYRDRLIRAYLGASNNKRRPDTFTGFDDSDNIQLHRLSGQRPLHILNAAINLVSGKKLAWQQRKSGSFIMTPFHCGSWITGFRPTNRFSRNPKLGTCKSGTCNKVNARIVQKKQEVRCNPGECEHPGKSLRLGTAMAISGAAANPNMGYYSSGIVTFLMALFNIRLGWWLGNPGRVEKITDKDGNLVGIRRSKDFWGRDYWTKTSPSIAVLPLMNETLGRTDGDKRYVNVSDGGHFENLGLYEVMLRRCKFVVLSDGTADGKFKFGDLSNAIRKCKVDLGIDIKLRDGMKIYERGVDLEDGETGMRFAIFDVTFPKTSTDRESGKGLLIYLRPTFYGNEPIEITGYAKQNLSFPHQSTGDQFYDEQQFEAYRSLGILTMNHVLSELDSTVLEKFRFRRTSRDE